MADPLQRRIPPPRTVTLESLEDVQAFRQSLARRLAAPRMRAALRIVQLSGSRTVAYERDLNRLLASTGWVAGSVGSALLIGAAIVAPIPPAGPESIAGLSAWLAEVALATVLGWWIGRGVGLLSLRWRLQRVCRRIEADVTGASAAS